MSEICWICKSKPACVVIVREDDGKLWLNIPAGSAVDNAVPLRYEVVPPPKPEIYSMPHEVGEICDACVRGYGMVGMLEIEEPFTVTVTFSESKEDVPVVRCGAKADLGYEGPMPDVSGVAGRQSAPRAEQITFARSQGIPITDENSKVACALPVGHKGNHYAWWRTNLCSRGRLVANWSGVPGDAWTFSPATDEHAKFQALLGEPAEGL